MIRQPAVWVNPRSYPGGFTGFADFDAINKMGVLRSALTTRLYPVDVVNVRSEKLAQLGIFAEEYDESAATAVNESTYVFDDGRTVYFKMGASSSYVPTNKQEDYRDGEYTPDEFVRGTITDALAMYVEKMLILGDESLNPLEPDGLVQPEILKQTNPATGAATPRTRIEAITRGAGMIRTGSGYCQPDMLICAPEAAERIQLDVGEVFGEVEPATIPGTNQPTFFVPTPYGRLLVVPSEFVPIGAGPEFYTTLYVAHTTGPMGLHIGMAQGSPDIEINTHQQPDKPGYSLVGTVKFALMCMDDSKLTEITNFSLA